MSTTLRKIRVVEVSRATGISVRTLRVYEREGLIEPAMREKGALVYSEETLERLRRIRRMKEELGVNLAGIQIILDMREKMERLQAGLAEVARYMAERQGGGLNAGRGGEAGKPAKPAPGGRPRKA